MKIIALILLLLQFFCLALPAQAARCQNFDGHQVCIISLKRSPKRYWNYRAVISIDGKKQPLEIYNCRSNFKIQKDGKIVSFTEDSPGKFICKNFKG